MGLSSSAFGPGSQFALSSRWLLAVIVCLFIAIFTLDCLTETAPVQHLYYIPIILSGMGLQLARRSGVRAGHDSAVPSGEPVVAGRPVRRVRSRAEHPVRRSRLRYSPAG